MGLSSSKTTTDQTTKPVAPAYVTQATQDYVNKVSAFGNSDPLARVAPVSELQQQAFTGAANLGGWQAASTAAAQAAAAAGKAPAAKAQTTTYDAPTIGNVPQATAQTYETAGAGTAQQAEGQSLLTNLEQYYNPYQQQVVDTTLADMDQEAARVRAQQMASGAGNKALSGSRFGVAQALTEAELQRARASADANLRASGFNTAAGLSAQDAGMRQQNSQFNVGQTNQFGLADASMRDQASRFGAEANNQFSMFNAQNELQRILQQAGLDAGEGQFNAGAANQTSQTNAQLQEQARQRALQAAGLQGDIASQGAVNARADTALQAALGEQQRAIQAGLLNADLSQLQAQGQLLGMAPFGTVVGQNTQGTQTQSGSLFGGLLGAASLIPSTGWAKIGL